MLHSRAVAGGNAVARDDDEGEDDRDEERSMSNETMENVVDGPYIVLLWIERLHRCCSVGER